MDTRLELPGILWYDIDTHLPLYYYSKEVVRRARRAKICIASMVNPDLPGEFHFNLDQKKRMSPQLHETVTPHTIVPNISPRLTHERPRRALAVAADPVRPHYAARLGRNCELTRCSELQKAEH